MLLVAGAGLGGRRGPAIHEQPGGHLCAQGGQVQGFGNVLFGVSHGWECWEVAMSTSSGSGGNLLGLVLSPLILTAFGWRALFYVFGFFGLPLLAMWLSAVPDTKPTHKSTPALDPSNSSSSSSNGPVQPQSSTAGAGKEGMSTGSGQSVEKREGGASTSGGAATGNVSIVSLMSKPATWAIVIVNVVNHFGYFIYLNWMPTYFVKVCPRLKQYDAALVLNKRVKAGLNVPLSSFDD
eukprot:1143281-Pelagomonas_calceolata.AAC.5